MSHISVEDTIWARDNLEEMFKSVGAKMISFSQEILSRNNFLTSEKIGVAKRSKVEVLNAFCIKDLFIIKSIPAKGLLYSIALKIHKINPSKRIIT